MSNCKNLGSVGTLGRLVRPFFALVAALLMSSPQEAPALGGNGSSTSTQVGADSKSCEDAIVAATSDFIAARNQRMFECFGALILCDQEANDAAATACRRALLEVGVGACAQGMLDSGQATMGAVSQTVFNAASSAYLDAALITYVNALQLGCFTSGSPVFGISGQGLYFPSTPANKFQLADILNAVPGGVSCQSNQLIREAMPLVDDVADLLKAYDKTCIAVSDGISLGATCTSDTQCGATSGKCGKVAHAIKNGGDAGFPSCPKVCGAGERLSSNTFGCTKCAVGSYTSSSGSTTCVACDTGKYSAVAGATSCLSCPVGQFQATTGNSQCTNCPP